ncbi:hypothetical protein [Thermogutta sp.]|jgi:hypothetical protein|uniref:hypothetical protein n=2 Tax=Thermogutta sp. TaxID=1962930 RepID=UPI00321F70D3
MTFESYDNPQRKLTLKEKEERRMAHGLYFIQGCPTCGRRVQVRMDYLGKYVTCHHCGAAFQADGGAKTGDGASRNGEQADSLSQAHLVHSRWKPANAVTWPFGPEMDV